MCPVSRRSVIAGAASTPIAASLAACGSDSGTPQVATAPDVPAGELVGLTSDVEVGGCAVFQDSKIVVTQPTAGEFKAFSALCTHEGCVVSSGDDGDIVCRCHMSRFALTDGAALSGPAKKPLPPITISVTADEIRTV